MVGGLEVEGCFGWLGGIIVVVVSFLEEVWRAGVFLFEEVV